MEKDANHHHYEIKDGILYEWYWSNRGLRSITIGRVPDAPDITYFTI